jgi:hypothetical protein
MGTGQKLLQTIERSYTTNVVDTSTFTSLAALTQEINYIHVHDSSGSRGQLAISDGGSSFTAVINYAAGGLTSKETRRLDRDEVLYLKAKGQSMTSGHLLISLFGG